jgi:hypothetical protein
MGIAHTVTMAENTLLLAMMTHNTTGKQYDTREADNTLPSGVEVKNAWIFTSTPLCNCVV